MFPDSTRQFASIKLSTLAALVVSPAALVFCAISSPAAADPISSDGPTSFAAALTGGQPKLQLRYRAEHVDDHSNQDAFASTLRAAFSYRTLPWQGFSAMAEVEHIVVLGNDDLFNDGGGNGVSDRAVVVDPEGTDLNQAWLRWARAGTELTLGRQEINHRNGPFHRFVGNVGWRQNHQSFDGARLAWRDDSRSLDVSWIGNANRIFGEDNTLPNRSDLRLDGVLARGTWSFSPALALEAYGYDLNFDDATALSSRTLGLRASGRRALPLTADKGLLSKTSLVYSLEYAFQQADHNNPNSHSASYRLLELGLHLPVAGGTLVQLGHAELGGSRDGSYAFQTPLATLHAFQGWADKFLTTPGSGLADTELRAVTKLAGFKLLLASHWFHADRGDTNLGRELDLQLTRAFPGGVSAGLKLAWFDASNSQAVPAALSRETGKAWLWAQVTF